MLFTVAFPNWSGDALAAVQAVRREADPQYALVEPHLTLLFGADLDEGIYLDHVAAVAHGTRPVTHRIGCALPFPEAGRGAHVCLVPDLGLSELVRLHDALYRGPLERALRYDIAYVPHVTLAHVPDALRARRIADEWNAHAPVIDGVFDALSVGTLRGGRFEVLAHFALEAA